MDLLTVAAIFVGGFVVGYLVPAPKWVQNILGDKK